MSITDNSRRLGDAELTATIALPVAGATVNTPVIDLGTQPYAAIESINVVVETTEATGVNGKTLTVTLQESDAAGSGFATAVGLGSRVITGAASKYAASTFTYKLQPGAKRYLRATVVSLDGASGNSSDGDVTASVRY